MQERGSGVDIYYEVCAGCESARQIIGSFVGEWKKDMNTNGLPVKLVACSNCGPGVMHAHYHYRRSKISAYVH